MALKKWGYMSTIVATLFVIIGYSTPYWLVSDLNIPKIRYYNLGLWNVCLNNFRDPLYLYDMVFNGCRYIPIEDLWFIRDQILEPAFFIAVQVLFTFCLICVLIACALVIMYSMCCTPENYKMLYGISLDLLIAATFGTMAVIIFGARGDGRDWMPDPDHNYLSWSFALAVIGVYFLWVGSLLFFIEGRRTRKQEKSQQHINYGMSTHSKV
uniref:Claudin n=1 Tax=Strigamia maritima TaxID=126957 RepID=T1J6A5_STRMM